MCKACLSSPRVIILASILRRRDQFAEKSVPHLLVKRFLVPSDYSADETWRLVEWCRGLGANEFTIDPLGFDTIGKNAARWFERAVRSQRRETGIRERMSGPTADALTRATELWALNESTVDVLKRALPNGLFEYEPRDGGWFEDPILYRDGQLMLGVLSHEAFAVLRVSDSEVAQLAAAGFPNHDSLPRIG